MALVCSFATPSVASGLSLATSRTSSRRTAVVCQAEPIRRPAPVSDAPASPAPPKPTAATASTSTPAAGGVTIEFQRQAAKDMVAYFQDKKFEEEARESQILGWTSKNEIGNGRWAMFGLAIGLLTEYATGVSFPDQLFIILSNLGIVD
eukprot:TRINITY_DN19447_c0_g1_i1.p2 TRINITY_DN19447_c0_g1~~TRINITY_DN19447_c0_g1_i1.p2  ORF type:complete len:149 (-),score=5.32 TRINITY_DN19447_c0_g1_i1:168-614(-)